jgi:cell division septation protein DedD
MLFSFIALSSCSKEISHEAKVDHYYSILVQPPHDVQNASYDWIVHEFPEESNLTYSDLLITSDGNELTFLPDKAGTYIFEIVVFDGREPAGSKKYTFEVTAPKPAKTEEFKDDEQQPQFSDSEPMEEQTGVESLSSSELVDPVIISENVDFIEEVGTVDEPDVEKIADEVIEAPTESALAANIPKNISSSVASSSSYLTIQVSASPTIERAEAVADTLEDLGFDVYIQRGYQGENEAVWYRVRVGTFSTMTEARNASDAIRSITDYDTWIDRVRKDL